MNWRFVHRRLSKRARFRDLEPRILTYLNDYYAKPDTSKNVGQRLAERMQLVNARLGVIKDLEQLSIAIPDALWVKDAPEEWVLIWMSVMVTFASRGALKMARGYEFIPPGFTGKEEQWEFRPKEC